MTLRGQANRALRYQSLLRTCRIGSLNVGTDPPLAGLKTENGARRPNLIAVKTTVLMNDFETRRNHERRGVVKTDDISLHTPLPASGYIAAYVSEGFVSVIGFFKIDAAITFDIAPIKTDMGFAGKSCSQARVTQQCLSSGRCKTACKKDYADQ